MKSLARFRRELEAAVLEARGEILLTDNASISTALRWERHARLAQKWLCENAAAMDHADRLAYSREVARASRERDKAIRELNIDHDAADVLTSIYARPPANEASYADPT